MSSVSRSAMFNHRSGKPRASTYESALAVPEQPWPSIDFNPMVSSTDINLSEAHRRHDQAFNPSLGLEWSTVASEAPSGYRQQASNEQDDIEMDTFMPAASSGGVGRLVAHFENKGIHDFGNNARLPPRPNHTTPQFAKGPTSEGQHNELAYMTDITPPPSYLPGRAEASMHLSNPPWGEAGRTGPRGFAADDNSNLASFETTNFGRVISPMPSMSPAEFGSLQGFMSVTMPQSSVTSPDPLSPRDLTSPKAKGISQGIGPTRGAAARPTGTPGFEIWRPPGSAPLKTEEAPGVSRTSASTGFTNQSMPSIVKTEGKEKNPFVLEFRKDEYSKGKMPAKPPRPRRPPPVPPSQSLKAKLEAVRAAPSNASSSSSATVQEQKPTPAARNSNGARTSREQVPVEAWEHFKPTIRALYLEERKPLKEVMAIMAEKYAFHATPKMYKTRFSQWGFVKNNTEEEVKKLLSMKFQRDAEGKISEFVRNGRVVNLGTYLKRKGVTEYDLVDFELVADLPAHIRCRTPTPPSVPGYLRSPDLVRAQELVVGNARKAFLQCRQSEVGSNVQVRWPVIMTWGAGSSDLLLEANFYFEAQDADQGGHYLMRAFKQLEIDLKQLSPMGLQELLLGMVRRDPGMMTALCKYLAAYSATNLEKSHPLRQIFGCLYEVQQKHGALTLSELLWGSFITIAEELEAIYSRRHPYVSRTWIDLALFYDHVNAERCEKLIAELRGQQRQVEQRYGPDSVDALTIRYSILQLLYAGAPRSTSTKRAAMDMWQHLKRLGVMFQVRDTKANVFCYHSPLKVDPWTKRCRRRYDSGCAIMLDHVGVKVLPYFEEDFHTTVHVPEPHQAWSAALEHTSSSRWAYI